MTIICSTHASEQASDARRSARALPARHGTVAWFWQTIGMLKPTAFIFVSILAFTGLLLGLDQLLRWEDARVATSPWLSIAANF